MFRIVVEEVRAWVWMVRAKSGATLAIAAMLVGDRALRRLTSGRSAWFSRRAASRLLALSQCVTPRPIIDQVDKLTRSQFGG